MCLNVSQKFNLYYPFEGIHKTEKVLLCKKQVLAQWLKTFRFFSSFFIPFSSIVKTFIIISWTKNENK